VTEFFSRGVPQASFLTGNHDADFSSLHHLDLGSGQVFVTHGDVFFDDIVPWSKDAVILRRRIVEGLTAIPPAMHHHLETRLNLFRRVAASIPQRHQSERNKLKFALHYIADTVWPPTRVFRVMRAWQLAPQRAAEFTRRHRAGAQFVVCGHTHRPDIWRSNLGVTVINTGSYCPPLGAYAVDLTETELLVRQVEIRAGEFRVAGNVAAFPLAGA
jgi:predicted phosphodiesterase